MSTVIVYEEDGRVCVGRSSGLYSLKKTAEKIVPDGAPYLLVDESALPDKDTQHAWEVDFSNPDGHGLSDADWLAKYPLPEQQGGMS